MKVLNNMSIILVAPPLEVLELKYQRTPDSLYYRESVFNWSILFTKGQFSTPLKTSTFKKKNNYSPKKFFNKFPYLKVPKLLNKNEGSIEFTLYGYDYPNHKNLPNLVYTPKAFDIALFP